MNQTNVKLIAVTQPVGATASESVLTGQDLLSYCARVSNPNNQTNFDTSSKLLAYCIKHKHWSVFEMASMVIEIETTRDIARQILRHRSFHFQEFSQRYAEVPGLVSRECRMQDPNNRQNSLKSSSHLVSGAWDQIVQDVSDKVEAAYKRALSLGIAKEVARTIIPEGMAITRMYMHGTVRDFYHYCSVRTGPETQKEHRDIAQLVQNILFENFPALEMVV